MGVKYHSVEIVSPRFGRRKLTDVLKWLASKHTKKLTEVDVIFCSDEYLLDVNRQHLKHDFLTDVITFDYCDGENISGDIFVSIDRLKENADSFGVKLENEIVRVVGHGFLHLLGYTDKMDDDKAKMTKMEDLLLFEWEQRP